MCPSSQKLVLYALALRLMDIDHLKKSPYDQLFIAGSLGPGRCREDQADTNTGRPTLRRTVGKYPSRKISERATQPELRFQLQILTPRTPGCFRTLVHSF